MIDRVKTKLFREQLIFEYFRRVIDCLLSVRLYARIEFRSFLFCYTPGLVALDFLLELPKLTLELLCIRIDKTKFPLV
ncbi:hypothetical protein AB395_00003377 [Sinorhizobium fredii CCBAU 45436]|nr:hypothetical protein AB395_00003377 [Sinorhizobium fredii CCBAU 45436]